MAKRKEEAPPPGSPAWMATFGDLMNLLLCFYVLLFSMSTIDAEKLKAVADSFNQTFSIFEGGATAIGEGILISNGVSQLNELDEYINSTGKAADNDGEAVDFNEYDELVEAAEKLQEASLMANEQLAERIEEAIAESKLNDVLEVQFNSQYVQLTLKGAVLYDSGKAEFRDEALPIIDKVGRILEKYATSTIEIEGHTDNVPMHSAKYADNSELSCARALSVFNYLIKTTSLDPANIKYSGRGEYVPIADNSTEEGRAKNRRVEIRIYHNLTAGQ